MLEIQKEELSDYQKSSEFEYLETNGLGGWSGLSITGSLTRRYHGLLVAATLPPTERMNLVNKLDETIVIGERKLELSSNLYSNDTIHPKGFQFLQKFSKGLFPEWVYEIEGIIFRKQLIMLHGQNTVLLRYDILEGAESLLLELRPHISGRGYHSLQTANNAINTHVNFENGLFGIKPYPNCPDIIIDVPGNQYQHDPQWYYGFIYAVERYRGLEDKEDLFVPGCIRAPIKQGESLYISVSTDKKPSGTYETLWDLEIKRRQALLEQSFHHSTEQLLTLAADQFIVKRGEDLKTVIAGYPWFTDWGRDTMISLPGLTLSTGRFEDARKILAAFAKNVSMGMLPNRFQDNNEPPEYNTVDGTLWYFIAIKRYLDYTGDLDFILKDLLPVLKDIIDWHFRGTRFNIHVDNDGLLFAGETGQQLTWMDARIGDWVVTPRMGKPVEIQALWYNSLLIFADLLDKNKQPEDANLVRLSASKCKASFIKTFWYREGTYLYDNIDQNNIPDPTLRPNQLFAISLPYALVEGGAARSIIKVIEENLYTPIGLRTLPISHPKFHPSYGGNAYTRDSAYHEGTVWSWLLGPYIDAIVRTGANNREAEGEDLSVEKATAIIKAFSYHLKESAIGSVSEIFDAVSPHHPRGCVAQAWGVAEILRVIKDYGLKV